MLYLFKIYITELIILIYLKESKKITEAIFYENVNYL